MIDVSFIPFYDFLNDKNIRMLINISQFIFNVHWKPNTYNYLLRA